MAALKDRTGWLSLPEAAEAARIALPALRYLMRRLGFALGAVQDERGDTYLAARRLQDLRWVASQRARGLSLGQIERLLLAGAPGASEPWERPQAEPRGDGRPADVAGPDDGPAPAQQRDHSLPFPFSPPARPSDPGRSQGSTPRHDLPFPAGDVRRELDALRQDNRELRERLEELIAWLRAGEVAPTPDAPGRGAPRREVQPQAVGQERVESAAVPRRAAVAASATPEVPEGAHLTRTPSGNLRPAVVRTWKPPALNGRR